MKYLLLLFFAISACTAGVLKDPVEGYKEGDRYFYFPGDGDDTLHLVDAEEPADFKFIEEYTRNSANNAYWLFTRSNPTSRQVLVQGNAASVTNSNFHFGKITVFLAHGLNGYGDNDMNKKLTQAFLQNADVNVIVLDWHRLADQVYTTARAGTAEVGRGLGRFIIWLAGLGMSYDRVHLVGFSLGGHLVGNAGRETGSRVRRITALDPAGPFWDNDPNRLVRTDARYVEVIHTEISFTGFRDLCGDADFYPNGGSNMPGCTNTLTPLSCSHGRAYEYMASSVKYNHLLANQCGSLNDATNNRCTGSLNPMGNSDINKSRAGIFRVNTRQDYPF
ncbi:lipase member H-like [Spodoptera frugiperda]|uniref:Lipase member H-like n=1 Tax=Spodoptera frugiperda TaxID=7108 RepID=A0A9R0DA40_SPOFR|nr:lipase member H-like [Spodoptera frugiperda]